MLTKPQKSASGTAKVRLQIASAAAAAGRDPSGITLIGVAKAQPLSRVQAAVDDGLADIGENYLQEAEQRLAALQGRPLTWHFIGALQGNKTRAVAERFDWVHTVDRLRIASRLSAQRPFHAPPLQVCLQVHLGHEPGKSGVEPAGLAELAAAVAALPRLKLRGLMSLPPEERDPIEQRRWFRELRELRDRLNATGHALDALSMGMSGDYHAAVAEGATHLRIGTALFGPRDQAPREEPAARL